MSRIMMRMAAALAALTLTAGARSGASTDELRETQAATRVAGQDLRAPLFLCRADSWDTVRKAMTQSDQWLPPTRAFDNLSYIGNGFVGSWVLETRDGLILFDATETEAQARDKLVPGLRALGLDPATIRYVIVTHGHWDHFGGAAWLQRNFGAHVALSAADWDLIESLPTEAAERNGAELPHRDLIVTDGQSIRLGDTTVRLYLTPGHTPGTVSAIVPARLGDKIHRLSLLGSVAFPQSAGPTAKAGGLLAYERSVSRFAAISREAGAEGIVNTHIFADGTRERIDALATRHDPAASPFLIGKDAVGRYYAVLDHCLRAAIIRSRRATQKPDLEKGLAGSH